MGEVLSCKKKWASTSPLSKLGACVTQNRNGQYAASQRFRMDDNIEKRVTQEGSTLQVAVQAVINRINAHLVGLRRALVSLSVEPVEIELALKTAQHGGGLD